MKADDQAAEFCLLGPLRVCRAGSELRVPPGKQRALLAALLLNAGRVVSFGELTEVLWAATPPPSARVALQNHVMRLRKALGGILIRTHPHGYQILADESGLDLSRFEAHLAAARSAARDGDWGTAAVQAGLGLDLWRGEALADVESALLAARDVPRLAELRLQALEVRLDADLRLGRHRQVIAELRALTAVHPLRERLHGLLMLALYRDGQQAGALAAYTRARQLIVRELGTEPGTALRQLHGQILQGDCALDVPPQAPGTPDGTAVPVPRQLPAAMPHFAGRGEELTALTGLLADRSGQARPAVVISAIGGTAGIGKTALALHWAHQVADRFPGGQLYVNLRGFDPSGTPVTPDTAVRGFLDALGVPSSRIPAQPEAQAGLYRSLLADREVLIVLDNARDEAQVRPLLPASPGSLVLVTSRSQLAGLAATEGARLLSLDVLGRDEAIALLVARLGGGRIAAEPDAAAELASLCAYLPLALAVTAARAAARPGFPLSALATELRDTAGRLDALDAGDPAVSIRAAFSWSCQQLTAEAARLFRLLGLHPGPDTSVPAAASLAATTVPEARRLLRELARRHLIAEQVPGRFTFHDLLRAYAADQARATDGEPERREAINRVLDHYLHTASTAADLLFPAREPVSLAAPSPGTVPEPVTGPRHAWAWFLAEYRVLLSAVTLAGDSGFSRHTWQLPWAMHNALAYFGHHQEWAAAQHTALSAATRAGDVSGQAVSTRLLARACTELGDYDQALAHYERSLRLYRQLGDHSGEAAVQQNLGILAERQGRPADALSHAEQALSFFRATGDKDRQATALNSAGWYHALLGDYQQTRVYCRQARVLCTETGDTTGEAYAWGSLGYAEHHLGNLGEAAACYERALGIIWDIGSHRQSEAALLDRLGDTHHAAGDLPAARHDWQRALAIFEDLQHPDAGKVRAKLDRVHS